MPVRRDDGLNKIPAFSARSGCDEHARSERCSGKTNFQQLDWGLAMQNANSNRLIFGLELSFVAVAIVLLTMMLVAAENYATNNHMLAAAEIANGSPLGGER